MNDLTQDDIEFVIWHLALKIKQLGKKVDSLERKQLNEVDHRRTKQIDAYLKTLDRLESILDKLEGGTE